MCLSSKTVINSNLTFLVELSLQPSTIVGSVKLENSSVIVNEYEMGEDNAGRRQIPFHCINEIEQYKCKTCPSFLTGFLTSLKHHLRNGHRNENPEEDIYECLKCFLVTHSKYLIVRHCHFSECERRNDNDRDINSTNQNASKFTRKARQIESHHSKPPDIQWFTCCHCPSKFKKRRYLNSHIKLCHTSPDDIQWFRCDHCPAELKRKSTMKRHVKLLHSKPEDIEWFKCDQCSQKFKQKGSLNKHVMLRHVKTEDIKWFKCDHCPSNFKHKGSLKNHVTSRHFKSEDIECFKCDQCRSKFKHKANFINHVVSYHSRPSKFEQKGNLKADINLRVLNILNVRKNSNQTGT